MHLSAKEFDLLAYLARNSGKVVSREQILSAIWGYDHDPGTNVVPVYVGYLRRKLALARASGADRDGALGRLPARLRAMTTADPSSAPESNPEAARERPARLGLRGRLALSIAAIVVVGFAITAFAVYRGTGSELRDRIDSDLAAEVDAVEASLTQSSETPAAVAAAARRYVARPALWSLGPSADHHCARGRDRDERARAARPGGRARGGRDPGRASARRPRRRSCWQRPTGIRRSNSSTPARSGC